MWTTFCVAGHVPGYEFRSIWGSPEPSASEAFFRPYGHNWHVDRARFDDDLRQALTAPGGIIRRYGKLVDVRQTGDAWDIVVDDGKILHARFLVDATGRSRALGRRLGATRRHFDQLVALVARVPRNQDLAYDNAIVVEARPDGWWYAAPVPDGHVIAYLTDRDRERASIAFILPRRCGKQRPDGHRVAVSLAPGRRCLCGTRSAVRVGSEPGDEQRHSCRGSDPGVS